jgi:hypothetical protein
LIVYTHTHALYKYVISFYHSNFYIDPAVEYSTISLTGLKDIDAHSIEYDLVNDTELVYRVTGDDPWILMTSPGPVSSSTGAIVLKIDVTVPKYGEYEIYWNNGDGIKESHRVEGVVSRGDNLIYRILPASNVYQIRFDYGIAGDQIKISNLAYGELRYRQFIPQLNKIFRMDPAKHQPLVNAYSSRFK